MRHFAGEEDHLKDVSTRHGSAVHNRIRRALVYTALTRTDLRLGEAMVSHPRTRTVTLTREGNALGTALASYAVEAMGAARNGAVASSFSGAGGHAHELRSTPAPARLWRRSRPTPPWRRPCNWCRPAC